MSRRHDVRRIKTHHSYTALEIAALMNVHLRTVRGWVMEGLQPIDRSRPQLIHGSVLAAFLAARNKPRQPLACGEIYCVACKAPKRPAGDTVTLMARAPTIGDLVGICPCCSRTMHRRVRLMQVAEKAGDLTVLNEDGTDAYHTARHSLRTAA